MEYPAVLAQIQEHLTNKNAVVQVTTYTKSWLYRSKHRDWFSADSRGLYVRQGKGKVDIQYAAIRFGRYV